MSKFKIRHITRYSYEDMVRDSANQIMLYPITDAYQDVLQHTVVVTDNPMINIHVDYFGNRVGTFTNAHPHRELTIDSRLSVETKHRPLPTDEQPVSLQWEELNNLKHQIEIIDYTKQERFEAFPEVEKIINEERQHNSSPLDSAKHFSAYIYKTFAYQKGITTVESTLDEVWKLKSGVCQDFAHMLLVMLRQINIPARYVSGYICPNKNGMRGEGATHAWVEAYIPFYGWLGLDPTNNCIANETHVRLAVGKNFSDCSPVKGTYRGTSNHTLDVSVAVSYEDGHSVMGEVELAPAKPVSTTTSVYNNSFRRHLEMQMQQQQQ
jgi:transglutaminase-like putative cysteine protease